MQLNCCHANMLLCTHVEVVCCCIGSGASESRPWILQVCFPSLLINASRNMLYCSARFMQSALHLRSCGMQLGPRSAAASARSLAATPASQIRPRTGLDLGCSLMWPIAGMWCDSDPAHVVHHCYDCCRVSTAVVDDLLARCESANGH